MERKNRSFDINFENYHQESEVMIGLRIQGIMLNAILFDLLWIEWWKEEFSVVIIFKIGFDPSKVFKLFSFYFSTEDMYQMTFQSKDPIIPISSPEKPPKKKISSTGAHGVPVENPTS